MSPRTFIQHILLAIIMATTTLLHADPLTIPDAYTGMDDILIPNPPFTYTTSYETYRFGPIVFTDAATEKLELGVYVYVSPDIQLRRNKLEDVVASWAAQQQTKPHAKFTILKKQEMKINHYPAYYLEYTSPGYEENSFPNRIYIQRVYFLQSHSGQVACFRLVRWDKQDKKTYLLEQWKEFIESIHFQEPTPYRENTIHISTGKRRYQAHDLNFEVPIGLSNDLNLWMNQQNAERVDHWQTPEGDITVRYKIVSGYDFSVEEGNKQIKSEKQGMAEQATAYLKLINPSYSTTHEYLETEFTKDRTIYGYIEYKTTSTGIVMEVAYKHGRTIAITMDGKIHAMEKYHKLILEWLKHFVIIPDG